MEGGEHASPSTHADGDAAVRTFTVTDSAQVAARAVAADQFVELLTAHWDKAYRFAYHLAGNVQEAEDLMQQAAEEAFRAFHRFQPGTRFDRWLMRILHNSFLDRMRQNRRRKVFSLEEVSSSTRATDWTADPQAAAEASLDGPVLRALDGLSPEFKAAVILIDVQGITYEDAAQILHCPIGTVRSRVHRGRLALREWLRPYVDAMKRGEL